VDLSGLKTAAGATAQDDWLRFYAASGGTVDLRSLRQVSGRTRFQVGTNGRLILGDLITSGATDIVLDDVTSQLDIGGSVYLNSGATLRMPPLAKLSVASSFVYAATAEANVDLSRSILQMNGSGLQWLEVGGEDRGLNGFTTGNFGIGQLIVGQPGQPTTVQLTDILDNGNRLSGQREALYLYGLGGADGLILNPGSTLVLDSIHVYAWLDGSWTDLNGLFAPGVYQIPFQGATLAVPEPSASVSFLAAGAIALRRRIRRTARGQRRA
jgi:hypothetical protein